MKLDGFPVEGFEDDPSKWISGAALETYPLRQKSANGQPKPQTSIERRCHRCGASFIGLAPGKTGEAGIWDSKSNWYCSIECAPK